MNPTRDDIIDALHQADVHATVDGYPVTVIGVGKADPTDSRSRDRAICRHPHGLVLLHPTENVILHGGAA